MCRYWLIGFLPAPALECRKRRHGIMTVFTFANHPALFLLADAKPSYPTAIKVVVSGELLIGHRVSLSVYLRDRMSPDMVEQFPAIDPPHSTLPDIV